MTDPENYSRRFTLENLEIRGQVVRLAGVWREMHEGRGYSLAVQQFLGELACVAVLIGAGLKNPGRATLQIQRKQVGGVYTGPLAVVDCTASATPTAWAPSLVATRFT